MKILFNFKLVEIQEVYFSTASHLKFIIDRFSELIDDSNEIAMLINDRAVAQSKGEIYNYRPELSTATISDLELRNAFESQYISHNEMSKKIYLGDVSEKQLNNFKKLYNEKLPNFEPDLILSFEYRDKIFDYVYPNSTQLTFTGGIFKRELLPYTFVLDPVGTVKNFFYNKYQDEIKNIKLKKEDIFYINKLKKELKEELISHSPIQATIDIYKKKYKKLLLLPLTFNHHWCSDTESNFQEQWDLISYVMNNIPKDIGVIVTQHSHNKFLRNSIFEKDAFLNWFANKYDNFIFLEDTEHIQASSLFILPNVDGIINVASTVGVLGLLFDCKIISLGKTFNDLFKDSQGIENIVDVLNATPKDKNNIIYWILTHYNIFPFQKNKNFMMKYMDKCCEHLRKNKEFQFSFYEKHSEMKDLYEYIIQYLRDNLETYNPPISKEQENYNYLEKSNFRNQIIKLAEKYKNKKIMLYGTGILANILFSQYDLSLLDIIGISDKKYGNTTDRKDFWGYKTYAPNEISNINPDYVLISAREPKYIIKDLRKTLKNQKIKIKPLIKKNFIKDYFNL